jgi:N-methylhydantoinase A
MCNTDIRCDLQRSALIALEQQHGLVLMKIAEALIEEATALLQAEGFAPERRRFVTQWNIRYVGQQSTIPVTVEHGEAVADIASRFEAEHQRLFGHTQPDGRHQIVSIKVSGFGALDRALSEDHAIRTARVGKPDDHREIWVDPAHDWREVPVFNGPSLAPRVLIDGPAIVEETTTTILVGARDRLRVTTAGNYIIELQ